MALVFKSKYKECPKCAYAGFSKVKKRKCFQCNRCSYQIYPLSKTVLASTKLPLQKWIDAAKAFIRSRRGVPAKELERELGIGYRHAWKIANGIRSLMKEDCTEKLNGVIEIDESYTGGKKKKKDHPFVNKKTIFGMLQRDGTVRAFQVENRDKATILPIIKEHIKQGSTIYSDEHGIYDCLKQEGYTHDSVKHSHYKWANGDVTTNRIEGFWSQHKRKYRNYIHTSKKYGQHYLNESAFYHDRRNDPDKVAIDLINRLFNYKIFEE